MKRDCSKNSKDSFFIILTLSLSLLFGKQIYAQQDVFSRDNVTTGNFGDGQLPWFYATSNNSQGDPDNGNTTRNYVKIGHNNNTTMTTNGRFYIMASLDFQASATAPRTINNSGGGLSVSGGIYNASSAIHTFNTPIGVDGTSVQIHTNSSGGFIFLQDIFINNNNLEFGNLGTGDITVSGTMQGSGNVQKVGTNTLIISGTHSYSGTTSIDAGTVILQGDITNSDVIVKSGASLEIDGNSTIKSITIEAGGYLKVNSGVTLTATNDVTLNSTSALYSSLINDGTIVGTLNYERFVNQIGSGASSGNDLISIPLTQFLLDFQSFLSFGNPENRTVLAANGANTVHAFAPYDNTNQQFVNLPTYLPTAPPDPSAELLVSGKGYRAASISGANITFTGEALSTDVSIDITTPNVLASQWNLIGNPYPSYLDAAKFLAANSDPMEDSAEAIYAYNSAAYSGGAATTGNYTIINAATIAAFPGENFNIAPGQGFFVPADVTPANFSGTISFTTGPTAADDMRTTSGSDDYIAGRNNDLTYVLKLALNTDATASFFFNDNASRGLDTGYDAKAFGSNTPIFSHLVEDNTGQPMALQALSISDLSDVSIPLGVNANQGEQLTFEIGETTLPSSVPVYLDDTIANTSTLLNTAEYTLTPNTNLNGTGRFYLRFTQSTLSTLNPSLDNLNIYSNKSDNTIVIAGQLKEATTVKLHDIQGRLVNTTFLENTTRLHTIDVSNLNPGIYVVQLENGSQNKTQKVIIY